MINYYTNGNKARFAKKLGIPAQNISAWITRNTFDAELIYAKCDDISADWLLSGAGNMLREKIRQSIGDNNKHLHNVNVVKTEDKAYEALLKIVENNQRSVEKFQEQTSHLIEMLKENMEIVKTLMVQK